MAVKLNIGKKKRSERCTCTCRRPLRAPTLCQAMVTFLVRIRSKVARNDVRVICMNVTAWRAWQAIVNHSRKSNASFHPLSFLSSLKIVKICRDQDHGECRFSSVLNGFSDEAPLVSSVSSSLVFDELLTSLVSVYKTRRIIGEYYCF